MNRAELQARFDRLRGVAGPQRVHRMIDPQLIRERIKFLIELGDAALCDNDWQEPDEVLLTSDTYRWVRQMPNTALPDHLHNNPE